MAAESALRYVSVTDLSPEATPLPRRAERTPPIREQDAGAIHSARPERRPTAMPEPGPGGGLPQRRPTATPAAEPGGGPPHRRPTAPPEPGTDASPPHPRPPAAPNPGP